MKINPVNINGNTPLHLACIFENLKIIKVLIQAKADIHKPNHRGQTPLFSAFSKGSFKVFEYLLRKGACFELINDEGEDLFFKDSQSSVLLSDYYKKQKVLYEQKKLKKDLPQNSKKTQIPRL